MKLIVRTFVVAIAFSGALVSAKQPALFATQIEHPTPGSTFPVPMCPPGDPDGCGIGRGGW